MSAALYTTTACLIRSQNCAFCFSAKLILHSDDSCAEAHNSTLSPMDLGLPLESSLLYIRLIIRLAASVYEVGCCCCQSWSSMIIFISQVGQAYYELYITRIAIVQHVAAFVECMTSGIITG